MFIRIDPKLQRTLDKARRRNKKNWDYVAVVAGIPGSGKSTFVQSVARYCCPWFDESYIAFNHEQFVDITNKAPEYSAVVLDESFQSLNSKLVMSPEFTEIINHLQIIRIKKLYIFLCLPNFFDLTKGVAIFRTSHLFVIYADDEGNRGRFLAFDRDGKRWLYIKGSKFMDYNAQKANFFGQYWDDEVVPRDLYEELKIKHLKAQTVEANIPRLKLNYAKLITYCYETKKMPLDELANVIGVTTSAISHYKSRYGHLIH